MAAIEKSVGSVALEVIEAAANFALPEPGSDVAAKKIGCPGGVMSLQGKLGITDPIGDLDQLGEVLHSLLIDLAGHP